MFRADYLLAEIPVARSMPETVYTRFGDWLAWVVTAGLLGALVLGYRRLFSGGAAPEVISPLILDRE
jgi:apolipoprotein N-acyltransferase